VENALTRSHEGVGLDLSLVKAMAEAHDASLHMRGLILAIVTSLLLAGADSPSCGC
jgi:hypothetical protein